MRREEEVADARVGPFRDVRRARRLRRGSPLPSTRCKALCRNATSLASLSVVVRSELPRTFVNVVSRSFTLVPTKTRTKSPRQVASQSTTNEISITKVGKMVYARSLIVSRRETRHTYQVHQTRVSTTDARISPPTLRRSPLFRNTLKTRLQTLVNRRRLTVLPTLEIASTTYQ
jgi:hypothetical protein